MSHPLHGNSKHFLRADGSVDRAAISEAFFRFDFDGSGKIDRQEFQQAMHTLGLRVSDDEYDVLFKKCDIDGSGEISVDEFSHMIKGFLAKPCKEGECHACEVTNGSNQPETVYRPRWADDSALLSPAASTLETALLASKARHGYLHQEERLEEGQPTQEPTQGPSSSADAPLSPSLPGNSASSAVAEHQESAKLEVHEQSDCICDLETGFLDDVERLEAEKARLQRAKESIEKERAVEGGATEMCSGVAAGSCDADELSKADDEMKASLRYAQRLEDEAQRCAEEERAAGERAAAALARAARMKRRAEKERQRENERNRRERQKGERKKEEETDGSVPTFQAEMRLRWKNHSVNQNLNHDNDAFTYNRESSFMTSALPKRHPSLAAGNNHGGGDTRETRGETSVYHYWLASVSPFYNHHRRKTPDQHSSENHACERY